MSDQSYPEIWEAISGSIKEQLAEGDGFWRSCSGCYETEDGQNVHGNPHSAVFGCILGSGCGECGGIGATWDTTDYAAMGEALANETRGGTGDDCSVGKRGEWPPEGKDGILAGRTPAQEQGVAARRDGIQSGDLAQPEPKHDSRVFFICQCCEEYAPENGVSCREDIGVMPDGTWLCYECYSDCDKSAYGMIASDVDDFEFPRFEDLPRPAAYPISSTESGSHAL